MPTELYTSQFSIHRVVRSSEVRFVPMNLVTSLLVFLGVLYSANGATIDHDQVQPFAQPEPVTISEKAAVKYKPQLVVSDGCVSFPAVNAAGDITGGLKGTKGTEDCTEAPLGSQVYGRSTWYQDKWAMVFAWYFPKNFRVDGPKSRNDWASMVLWIDNPALEAPTILGASLSQQTLEPWEFLGMSLTERKEPYSKFTQIPAMGFVGTQRIATNRISRLRWNYTYVGGSNVSTRIAHTYPTKFDWIALTFSYSDGEFQDLIMWEQLTKEARAALDSADFEEAKVPFNEKNLDTTLGLAWPF